MSDGIVTCMEHQDELVKMGMKLMSIASLSSFKKRIWVLVFAGLSYGCQFETMTGGPCEYEDFEETTQILVVNDTQIIAKGIEHSYEINAEFFEVPPKAGEKYHVSVKQITSGSCAPIIINSLQKVSMHPTLQKESEQFQNVMKMQAP